MKRPKISVAPAGKKSALLFYPFLSFVFFFQCLVLGKSYFHDDLVTSYSVCRLFLREQILQGHFPLWNPYLSGGQPVFGDPMYMAGYPLLYPTLLFPGAYGLSVFFFLHMTLAAIGMHFLLRALKLSEGACFTGAVLFSLSGSFLAEIVHPNILAAFCWLPWVIASLESFIQKPRPWPAFATGFSLALLFLVGHHQVSLFAAYATVLYLVLAFFREDRPKLQVFQKTFLDSTVAFLWGLFPLFLWLIPALEVLARSTRFNEPLSYAFSADLSLDPRALIQVLFPTPPLGPTALPYDQYLDNAGYLGLWAPFLIFLPLWQWRKNRLAFMAMGLLGILLAFGQWLPFHRWACFLLPGLHLLRSPIRYLLFYTLGGAVLAAMGFDLLEKGWKTLKPKNLITGVLAYCLFLGVVLFWKAGTQWYQVIFLVMGALALLWKLKAKAVDNRPLRVFQAALILSLLLNGWNVLSAGPASNLNYGERLSFLAQVEKEIGHERVLIDPKIPYEVKTDRNRYLAKFPVDAAALFGIKTVSGYTDLTFTQTRDFEGLPLGTYMKLMAVNGFLVGKGRDMGPDFLEEDFGEARFFRHRERFPLVWTAPRVQVIRDEAMLLKALGQEGFDPYQGTLLSEPLPPLDEMDFAQRDKNMSWEMLKDDPDDEVFHIHLDHLALVVFSEVVDPGWKSFLDGNPVNPIAADHHLRSFLVPTGDHEVHFAYQPWWLGLVGLLGLTWLFSLAIGGFLFLRKLSS